MSTAPIYPEEQPLRKGHPPNKVEALKLINQWLETDDTDTDTSDWDHLKALLDHDRISGRKLFSNE